MVARAFVLLALSVALAVMVSVAAATQARAEGYTPSPTTAPQGIPTGGLSEQERFTSACIKEDEGVFEFVASDGCFEWAESLYVELENIAESAEKGCSLSDLFEDFSCKGPSAPSSSSVSEQEEVSEARL